MLNPFFVHGNKGEQNLVQSLSDELIQMYGIEFTYMPRHYVNRKTVLREVTTSDFTKTFPIEGYIENYEGFGDNHNLLTKFGVRSTAEMSIVISKARFQEYIVPLLQDQGGVGLSKDPVRPLEGDLIYFPLADILFEVKYVEHEANFYQLEENYSYTLKCEVFEYEDEKIDTGIKEIDDDFATIGYNATLTLVGVGTTATAETSLVNGGIHQIKIFNEGTGYTGDPTILISKPNGTGRRATAVAITTDNPQGSRSLHEIRITDPGFGYTSLPSVTVSPTDGNGGGVSIGVGIATTGAVGIVTITSGGTDYNIQPTITFSAAPSGGVTAIGTAIISNRSLTAIQVTNAGYGYTLSPSITVGAAGTIGIGTFHYGDTIKGTDTETTAYATSWDVSTGKLTAKNLTGKFAINEVLTTVGVAITASYRINSVNYDDDDAFEDNQEIQIESDGILDFTEQNPFGEA